MRRRPPPRPMRRTNARRPISGDRLLATARRILGDPAYRRDLRRRAHLPARAAGAVARSAELSGRPRRRARGAPPPRRPPDRPVDARRRRRPASTRVSRRSRRSAPSSPRSASPSPATSPRSGRAMRRSASPAPGRCGCGRAASTPTTSTRAAGSRPPSTSPCRPRWPTNDSRRLAVRRAGAADAARCRRSTSSAEPACWPVPVQLWHGTVPFGGDEARLASPSTWRGLSKGPSSRAQRERVDPEPRRRRPDGLSPWNRQSARLGAAAPLGRVTVLKPGRPSALGDDPRRRRDGRRCRGRPPCPARGGRRRTGRPARP